MISRSVIAVVLVLCPIGIAASASDLPEPQRDLCSPGETIVFSCSVAEEKIVSLCASPDLSRNTGYMQYRYGRDPGRIELTYPHRTERTDATFKYLQEYAARGGTSAISFRVGRFRYSVFRTTSAFGFNGGGVIVDRGPRRIAYLKCDDKTIITQADRFYQLSGLGFPDARGDVSYVGADDEE
jgi:hypothetical protein